MRLAASALAASTRAVVSWRSVVPCDQLLGECGAGGLPEEDDDRPPTGEDGGRVLDGFLGVFRSVVAEQDRPAPRSSRLHPFTDAPECLPRMPGATGRTTVIHVSLT